MPLRAFSPSVPPKTQPVSRNEPVRHRTPTPKASVVVAGVLAVDISMVPASSSPLKTTAPGSVKLTLGGVAGNVAGAAHSLLSSSASSADEVLLLAPVAEDTLGDVARGGLARRGMRTDGLVAPPGGRTATCGILLDEKGDLVGGIADMAIAHELEADQVSRLRLSLSRVPCIDACRYDVDCTADTLSYACDCVLRRQPLAGGYARNCDALFREQRTE